MTRTNSGSTREMRVSPISCHNGIGLGTEVLTADGALPVEYLLPGDRVVTFDQGLVPLERTEFRDVPARATVRVRPSVVQPEAQVAEFTLSARQQVLIRDWRARFLWNRPVAIVEAHQLVDGAYIIRGKGTAVTRLFRLVFANRQHLVDVGGGAMHLASARMPARVHG